MSWNLLSDVHVFSVHHPSKPGTPYPGFPFHNGIFIRGHHPLGFHITTDFSSGDTIPWVSISQRIFHPGTPSPGFPFHNGFFIWVSIPQRIFHPGTPSPGFLFHNGVHIRVQQISAHNRTPGKKTQTQERLTYLINCSGSLSTIASLSLLAVLWYAQHRNSGHSLRLAASPQSSRFSAI